MFKKMLATSVTIPLSIALVGILGGGVASAHGGHVGGGNAGAHGPHLGGGTTVHGGKNTGGDSGNSAGDDSGNGPGTSAPNTGGGDNVGSRPSVSVPNVGGGAAIHGKGKGGKKGSALLLAGSTTCSIHGKVTFNPPLTTGGTASTTVTVTGLPNRCSDTKQGNVKFNNGHLSALVGTLSADDCAALTSVTPALSGGSVMWTPPSKIAASNGISMPPGAGSVVTHSGKSVIQISYSGGSVGSGSFMNTGASSLRLTSMQDTTQLSARCKSGLTNVTFSGTATL
jgi:hypothetical protein